MHRLPTYVIVALVAVILTILPAALWPDMTLPMEDNWENWYWKGQPHPRPSFSLQNPPPLFAAEIRFYKALVAPPAYVSRALTGWPTSYASFFMTPYRETAGLPPLAMALEHARWAFPTWFATLLLIVEFWRLFLRRRYRRAATATAGATMLLTLLLLGGRAVEHAVRPSDVPANAIGPAGQTADIRLRANTDGKSLT